jgi:hypothetical protein
MELGESALRYAPDRMESSDENDRSQRHNSCPGLMERHATGLRTIGVAIVQVLATYWYGSFEFG